MHLKFLKNIRILNICRSFPNLHWLLSYYQFWDFHKIIVGRSFPNLHWLLSYYQFWDFHKIIVVKHLLEQCCLQWQKLAADISQFTSIALLDFCQNIILPNCFCHIVAEPKNNGMCVWHHFCKLKLKQRK
jgi:hypothetical protein